jgi:hypothetical protein
MSRSQNNSFDWRGKPSETGAALGRTQTAPKTTPKPISIRSMPAKDHPLRNGKKSKRSTDNAFTGAGGQIKPERQPPAVYKTPGLVTPSNNGFSIPSRLQAQADTDKRHALRKGGI